VCTVTWNALLIEPIPLAFFETVMAPGNYFVPMNNQAAALLFSPNLPVISSSISRALITDLRDGQRTLNTSIINDLALRANENATETEDCCTDIIKYQVVVGIFIQ
jgi:hypothetical protein